MHLSVEPNALQHLAPIRFEGTAVIVQVHAGDEGYEPIAKPGGKTPGEPWVEPRLPPAAGVAPTHSLNVGHRVESRTQTIITTVLTKSKVVEIIIAPVIITGRLMRIVTCKTTTPVLEFFYQIQISEQELQFWQKEVK